MQVHLYPCHILNYVQYCQAYWICNMLFVHIGRTTYNYCEVQDSQRATQTLTFSAVPVCWILPLQYECSLTGPDHQHISNQLQM